jgi:hypothetical protein
MIKPYVTNKYMATMNNLHISRISFTDMFWRVIFSNGAGIIDEVKRSILSKHLDIEALRSKAEYNTGSISIAASVSLSLLASYFRPQIIAEVGTFIGRSTYSVSLGISLCGVKPPQIHTCDISNDIRVDFDPILKEVIQYPKKSSIEMFNAFIAQGVVPDAYLLDGRIQQDDIGLLVRLHAESAVIILDDFEGTEKGVSNAFTLLNVFQNNFLLAYPPSISLLKANGFTDASTTAVLIPRSKVIFTNQG